MKKWTSMFLLVFLLVAGFASAQTASNAENQVFLAKAAELTSGLTGRVDKVIAVHAFVRDTIAQATTQYG